MWVRIKTVDKESVETESLSAHVALQKEREAVVNKEIEEIKSRQHAFEQKEEERKTFMFRTLIGAIISSLTSVAFVLVDYLKK